MEQAWDVDGHFKLEVRGYDIFLTVHPPFGKGKRVEVDDVLSAVSQWNDAVVDINLVAQVANDANETEVRVGEIQTQPKVSRVLAEVTYDEMKAYLTINQEVDIREIDRELRRNDVFHGINHELISYMLEKKEFGKPTLIAQATPPIPGEDAKISFMFNINKEIHLKEKEDGKVDFKELGLINVVNAGQVLAVKKPATSGIAGMTVKGNEIYAKDGRDIPLPVGKNTEISEDGLKLLAKIDGQVVFRDNKVNVESVFEVMGDVDYSVGNIDFPGSVTIAGSILDGFRVKSGGNIEVGGCIEKAYVYAEGNIIVGAGIIGRDEGEVKAKKNVYANFVEHGNIEAGEDIIINESIRHSNINAKKRVIVQGRIGVILGGKIRAGEEINAKVIGSVTGAPTIVETGSLPLLRDEIQKLKEELVTDEEKFKGVEQGIKYLLDLKEKMGDKFPEDKEKLLIQHVQAKNTLKEKLYTMSMALPILEGEIHQAKGGKICVYKVAYPGVKISIRSVSMEVENEYRFVTFTALAGAIKIAPYEEPRGIRIVKEEFPKGKLIFEPKGIEKPKPPKPEEELPVAKEPEMPQVAKLKIRLISDSAKGVRLEKLKVGDKVYAKIVDKNELRKVRDLVALKSGGVVESAIEKLSTLDSLRSKIIARLGPGVIGETIVANKSKIKVPKRKLRIFK
ncbi:MAG: FapA family protein [bacterium]